MFKRLFKWLKKPQSKIDRQAVEIWCDEDVSIPYHYEVKVHHTKQCLESNRRCFYPKDQDMISPLPEDDELSIFQGSPNTSDMSIYFTYQFVQGEKKQSVAQGTTSVYPVLEYGPLLAGSITGKILVDGEVLQTFVEAEDGVFSVSDTESEVKVLAGTVSNGVICFEWNVHPGLTEIIVDYEYDFRAEQ